ncbi:hypothetical protein AAVH_07046 [Aphelenchoides avenae]|nr:hypothetical protein AAVH_07046 [Aphelenchus avenae]
MCHTIRQAGHVQVFHWISPNSRYNETIAQVNGKPWHQIGGRPWHDPADPPGGTCSQGHDLSDPTAKTKEKLVQPGQKVLIFFDEDVAYDYQAATRENPDPEELRKARRHGEICRRLSVTPHKWQALLSSLSNVPDEVLRVVLLPLGRWTLDAVQFTNRRLLQLITERMSDVCSREIKATSFRAPSRRITLTEAGSFKSSVGRSD